MHMSSATLPSCGKIGGKSRWPDLPHLLEGVLRRQAASASAPCSWAIGWPLVNDSGIGLPFISASFGL